MASVSVALMPTIGMAPREVDVLRLLAEGPDRTPGRQPRSSPTPHAPSRTFRPARPGDAVATAAPSRAHHRPSPTNCGLHDHYEDHENYEDREHYKRREHYECHDHYEHRARHKHFERHKHHERDTSDELRSR
ncbi:hypothetical protein ACWHA1_21370 [Streptomyces decoyicus]